MRKCDYMMTTMTAALASFAKEFAEREWLLAGGYAVFGGAPNSRLRKPRSKYSPHQGARECARRMRQIAKAEGRS